MSKELKSLYLKIDHLKKEIQMAQNKIPQKALLDFSHQQEIEYTYQSNKIEGNTLTLEETALIIDKRITTGKNLAEYLEALNHFEAIQLIKDLIQAKSAFSSFYVLSIHQLILRELNHQYAGKYRNCAVEIAGSSHRPPAHFHLKELMDDYFAFYQNHQSTMHPIELASEMHEQLVTIHPFIDGNGRTSRLVMNWILMQNDYPFLIIEAEKRFEYYRYLEEVRINQNKLPFKLLMANYLLKNSQKVLAFLKQ